MTSLAIAKASAKLANFIALVSCWWMICFG
jgi:hypothetical protein